MASDDEGWMAAALNEAQRASAHGDIPVGAVIVLDGAIIGRGHNRRHADEDPLAHAEMQALRDAARAVGNWRLDGGTMYVTLEPCPMCAGAMVQARLARVVFGAFEPKSGAVRSVYQLCDDPRATHRMQVTSGVCQEASSRALRSFFAQRRTSWRGVPSGEVAEWSKASDSKSDERL